MKPTLLVLAAGIGSRYGGLKQMDRLGPGGETIIDYSVFDAKRAGFGKVVFVIRRSIEADFRAFFEGRYPGMEIDFAHQELDMLPEGFSLPADRVKPWGTGHAVLVGKDKIDTPFAMINADDYYGREAFQVMGDYLRTVDPAQDHYSMVGYKLANTLSDHGSVSRGVCEVDENGYLLSVTERTKIAREGGQVFYEDEGQRHPLADETIVSMNMFGFTPTVFGYLEASFRRFLSQRLHEPKAELYVPTVMSEAIDQHGASLRVLTSDAQWFGVTYQEDRPVVVEAFARLSEAGTYPHPLWGG